MRVAYTTRIEIAGMFPEELFRVYKELSRSRWHAWPSFAEIRRGTIRGPSKCSGAKAHRICQLMNHLHHPNAPLFGKITDFYKKQQFDSTMPDNPRQ